MADSKTQQEDIAQLMTDAILEKPITFTLDGRYYYIYPPSLGTSMLSADLLKELRFDRQLLAINQQYEMLRLCTEQKEIVRRIIAIHSFQRRSDAVHEEKVLQRLKDLAPLDAAELSTILLAIMNWHGWQDKLTKHIGLDKERDQRQKIHRIKEDDSSSLTFGGNSLYGSLLDYAAERYGWELGYILWGISAINLNMMLADSIQSVYLTEEERKKVHIPRKGRVIRADDPKNQALVERFLAGK